MDELVFTKVRVDDEILLYPVSAIKRIGRTDDDERSDCVQFYGDDRWHDCVDAEDETSEIVSFEQSLVEYKEDNSNE